MFVCIVILVRKFEAVGHEHSSLVHVIFVNGYFNTLIQRIGLICSLTFLQYNG